MTSIKFRRPLQTNEPVNDRAFPIDREISVIAAIGPLNIRREANAHSHTSVDINSDDIQIDFAARVIFHSNFLASIIFLRTFSSRLERPIVSNVAVRYQRRQR